LNRPITIDDITIKMNVNSSNTIYCILRGETYKDYIDDYKKITESEKNKLATLLRNQYCKTP